MPDALKSSDNHDLRPFLLRANGRQARCLRSGFFI